MKKLVRNLFAALAAAALLGSLASCAASDEEDPFVAAPNSGTKSGNSGNTPASTGGNANQCEKTYKTIEVTEMTGVTTEWGDTDDLKVGADYTSQLTAGSKIYIDASKNGDYLKFHVDNGTWNACGVTTYYNEDGTVVSKVEEDSENPGVWNMEGEGGVYYFEVTSENIEKLKAGFAIHGNIVINKMTFKILESTTAADSGNNGNNTPTTPSEPTTPSQNKVYGECKTYTVTTTADVEAENFAMVLQLDNDGSKDADGLKVDVTDFELWLKIGENEPITITKEAINLIPNQWASPEYDKTDCRFVLDGVTEKVASGTTVQFKVVKATVNNKDKADSIIYCLQDNSHYNMFVGDDDNYKAIFASKE